MRPLHQAIRRAIWFGGVAAVLTFLPIYFSEEIEALRFPQRRIYLTHCGYDDSASRACVWTFIAYVAVFTPTLLLSAGRTRCDMFRR